MLIFPYNPLVLIMPKFEQCPKGPLAGRDGRKSEGRGKFESSLFVLLNTIAPTYHSAFGYNLEDQAYEKGSFYSYVTVPFVEMRPAEEGTIFPKGTLWWADTDLIMAEQVAKTHFFQHKLVKLELMEVYAI